MKLTRPMARAFGEYWNTRGRELALTLALTKAEARRLHAAGVLEEELLSGEAHGASIGGAGASAVPAMADVTPEEPRGGAGGRSDTQPSAWPQV